MTIASAPFIQEPTEPGLPSPDEIRSRRRASLRRRETLWIWLFLLPTVVLYGVYTIYPIVASYWYSFVEWNGFEADKRFVGLRNYRQVFADPLFWNSFKVTLLFMILVAPARIILSFLLAIVLNSPKLPISKVFRTVFFLPVVTTTAIVGVVMQFIFDPGSGPVNALLQALGHPGGINFLGDSKTALVTVSLVYVWKFFGITMVYWLAALQTIPQDIYEAARIDGAGALRQFRHITLPMLGPTFLFVGIITAIGYLQLFAEPYVMTPEGGPLNSTLSVVMLMYREGFRWWTLGYAAAIAAVLFVIIVATSLIQLRLRRKEA